MSARSANASRSEPDIARCVCGRLPSSRMDHAGKIRLLWIACVCGRATGKSERFIDVLCEWNDKQLAARPKPAEASA